MRPRATILVMAALLALVLAALECDDLSSGALAQLEPLRSRFSAALDGFCGAASASLAREDEGHVPGCVFAAVRMGAFAAGLDRDGYVASVDSTCKLEGVPRLAGFTLGPAPRGALASSPEAFLGITVIKAFEAAPGLAGLVKSVDLEQLENPEVTLATGAVVRLGTGDYALKLERLGEVLWQAAYLGMEPTLIDLRFRDQVVVRPGTIADSKDREV